MEHSVISLWVIILAIGTTFVAIFQRVRLSPILGYLATGFVIGPASLGLLEDGPVLRLLAELGVVLLMFTIGLEFSLSRLLAAKRLVLGVGGGQVLITSLVLGGIAVWLGLSWGEAVIAGIALSLSSTAIVLKQLEEQNELSSSHGRITTGVLLFQDIAAVPILVSLPILASGETQMASALGAALSKAALVFIGLMIAGRYLLPPVLHWVAGTRSLELFMLSALLMAVAAAALSHLAGLSPTLGAFMAGALLGETHFKHQIEADIRPFRDLMLGMFFLSIGIQLNPHVFINQPIAITLIVAAFLLVKPLILIPVVKAGKHRAKDAWHAAITLAHGGEFSLLVVSTALAFGIFSDALAQPMLAAVILSMVLTPLLMRVSKPLADTIVNTKNLANDLNEEGVIEDKSKSMQDHVILCGYGRLGQNVFQILQAERIEVLALDRDPDRVHEAAAAGEPVLYGNATQPGVLRAAGLDRAKALAITISDVQVTKCIIELARCYGFDKPILVRSHRGRYEEELGDTGASVFPEGLETSLAFAGQLLIMMDVPSSQVEARLNSIRAEDYTILRSFFHATYGAKSQQEQLDYPQQMRSVVLHEGHYAKGRPYEELQINEQGVELVYIRRGSIRVPMWLLDSRLREGDVLVLCGQKEALDAAIAYLTDGP